MPWQKVFFFGTFPLPKRSNLIIKSELFFDRNQKAKRSQGGKKSIPNSVLLKFSAPLTFLRSRKTRPAREKQFHVPKNMLMLW